MILSIIIVSYNAKDLLDQCIHSLFAQKFESDLPQDFEVIVVDNASTDGSPELIAVKYPHIKLIRNSQNLGFGRANDLGAKIASGDYLYFLNSDTVMRPNHLQEIFMLITTRHPAIFSCKLINPDGSLQPQGGFAPNLINTFFWMVNLDNVPLLRRLVRPYQLRYASFFQKDQLIGWVGGTAMVIKASIFSQLNGFDPQIFMYAEDVDFCYRAKKAGLRVYYFASSSLIHRGQGSGSTLQSITGEFDGLKYIFKKHKPQWQLPLLRLNLKLGSLLRCVVFAIIGKHERSKIYKQAYQVA